MGRLRVVLGLLLLAASSDAFLPSALRPAVMRAASPRSKTWSRLQMVETGARMLKWSTGDKGELLVHDTNLGKDITFTLKGVNWSGFEDGSRTPGGCWNFKIREIVGFLRYWGFNAVRLPVSLDLALNLDAYSSNKIQDQWQGDASLLDTPRKRLLATIDELGKQGILVMLDMHRLHESGNDNGYMQGAFWWDNNGVSEDMFKRGWYNLLDACHDKWNVFACDLKNEPQLAKWETSDRSQYRPNGEHWNLFAEVLIEDLAARYPSYQGLFFVEGIEYRGTHSTGWGGYIAPLKQFPIKARGAEKRVVYSPHVYGPSVYLRSYHDCLKDPSKSWQDLFDVWTEQWGFANKLGYAVVLGEWGGWNGEDPWSLPLTQQQQTEQKNRAIHDDRLDADWHRAMVMYMRNNGYLNQFYWVLNPGFGDSGGLVRGADWPPAGSSIPGEDDALNPNGVGKMALMGVKEGSLYEKQHPTAINTDNFPNFKWGTWKGENAFDWPQAKEVAATA